MITKPATLTLAIIGFIVGVIFIWYAGRRLPTLRSFPAVDAIPEMIGRCVEMGRPVLVTPGAYGAELNKPGPTVASLPITHYVARQAAKYGVRFIAGVAFSDTYAAVVNAVEAAYRAEGKMELYNASDIHYLGNLEGYVVGIPSIMASENIGALIQTGNPAAAGNYINEMGARMGAMTSTLAPTSGADIAIYSLTADYLLMGEEYYAASAIIAGDKTQLGSIQGNDLLKLAVVVLILIGIILTAAAPSLAKTFIGLFNV